MEQNQPVLGRKPDENSRRDAIHIAIAPAIAGDFLSPGQRVGQRADGKFGADALPHIGIVDPFLPNALAPDSEFWLCLFPYSITSLRHVWTHPTFKPAPPGKEH